MKFTATMEARDMETALEFALRRWDDTFNGIYNRACTLSGFNDGLRITSMVWAATYMVRKQIPRCR